MNLGFKNEMGFGSVDVSVTVSLPPLLTKDMCLFWRIFSLCHGDGCLCQLGSWVFVKQNTGDRGRKRQQEAKMGLCIGKG